MDSKEPRKRARRGRIDEKLDGALKDTFPASDPVSFIEPAPKPRERYAARQAARR